MKRLEFDISTFEHVTGSMHGDSLTGDHRVNHLTGGGGDDSLRGGAGADRVIGGPGADMLDGGEDEDERTTSFLEQILITMMSLMTAMTLQQMPP